MDVKNVSFGAKQSVIGSCSATLRTRLAEKLSSIGSDEFTHSVEFSKDKIVASSFYEKGDQMISISGPIQILRRNKDSESDVMRNLVDFAKSQVEFFKQTQKGIMD